MSTTIGIFVLGILCGWLLEWLFVSFFMRKSPQLPPKTPLPLEVTTNPQQVVLLEEQNHQLQNALAAAKQTISELETSLQQTQVFLSEQPPTTSNDTSVSSTIAASGQDDLTRLKGIGPRLEQVMHEAGINTYTQLMNMNGKALAAALEPSGILFSRAIVDSWPIQAKLAAEGKWDELRKYKSTLKA